MTDDKLVYMSKFWPTPKTPARVRIELNVEANEPSGGKHTYDYLAEVFLPDGSNRGVGGTVEAESKQHANLKAMFKLVTLLGEMLADATEKMESR